MHGQKIVDLTNQLYPTGRAWKMSRNGWFESLTQALSLSENKAYNDAVSIQNSILPDNQYFTVDDATDWERRLGMIQQPATVPLSVRKDAIIRKMNHPGTIKARQHFLYVQGQLRDAGFNVFVHENRFPDGMGGYITKTPIQLSGYGGVNANQLADNQLADAQLGGTWGNLVANNIDLQKDLLFNVGNNLRSTFFIGGTPVGSYASVPIARMTEFRQLILKLKPCQTVAYLFIVYV